MLTPADIVGVWRLQSWSTTSADQHTYPFGSDPIGRLIYTADGYMSATIVRSQRAPVQLPARNVVQLQSLVRNPLQILPALSAVGAGIRYFQAATGTIAYSGTYDLQGTSVVHHVDASLLPDWMGQDLVRTYEWSDGVLCLSPPLDHGVNHCLRWIREST